MQSWRNILKQLLKFVLNEGFVQELRLLDLHLISKFTNNNVPDIWTKQSLSHLWYLAQDPIKKKKAHISLQMEMYMFQKEDTANW